MNKVELQAKADALNDEIDQLLSLWPSPYNVYIRIQVSRGSISLEVSRPQAWPLAAKESGNVFSRFGPRKGGESQRGK